MTSLLLLASRRLRFSPGVVGCAAAVSLLIVSNAQAFRIDDFGATVADAPGAIFVTAGNPAGGELDILSAGGTTFGQSGGQAVVRAFTAAGGGSTTLVYDGLDGNVDLGLGLGGIDLTDSGRSDLLEIIVSEASGHNGVFLRIYSSETEYSSIGRSRISAPQTLLISLALAQARGPDGGADLQSVRRIEIDVVKNFGSSAFSLESIATVPEPGTAMLLGLGLAVLSRRPRESR